MSGAESSRAANWTSRERAQKRSSGWPSHFIILWPWPALSSDRIITGDGEHVGVVGQRRWRRLSRFDHPPHVRTALPIRLRLRASINRESSAMSLSYVHTLIPDQVEYAPRAIQVADFFAGLAELGAVPTKARLVIVTSRFLSSHFTPSLTPEASHTNSRWAAVCGRKLFQPLTITEME